MVRSSAASIASGGAVGGAHRLPVVEFQSVAQADAPSALVVGDVMAGRHLWMRPQITVDRVKHIEHVVSMQHGDAERGPDGIENHQVR
jgi:hypothetical protein